MFYGILTKVIWSVLVIYANMSNLLFVKPETISVQIVYNRVKWGIIGYRIRVKSMLEFVYFSGFRC